MDFTLSFEQKTIQKLARDFAAKEVLPVAAKYEKEGIFPRDIIRKMGELGFMGCAFPEEIGGSELGFMNMVLIIEEITKVMASLGSAFNMNAMTCPYAIAMFGTDEQKQKYVRPLITGEKIGYMGLTEPGGGSDVLGGMKTRAVKDGDYYVLNGSKTFITFATEADWGVLYCKTDPSKGHAGISGFIIETNTPGFTATRINTVGMGKAVPTCEIALEDVRVHKDNLLGEENKGFGYAMTALDHGRITVATRAVGLAQASLDAALKYANEREAFGQKIGKYQMVQRLIAETICDVEAARLLVYRAAYLMDCGYVPTRESSIAKYFAAETSYKASQVAVEIFGGYGVCEEYPISLYNGQAQLVRTGEGSPNIQRQLIAQDALGYKKASRGNRRIIKLRSDIVEPEE
ncbi:MAG: acyl-CoA dehydrogenase [Firmicutes bacterium]|nr:acyl-CoA dehydrogenase [Bacillota bacterium]